MKRSFSLLSMFWNIQVLLSMISTVDGSLLTPASRQIFDLPDIGIKPLSEANVNVDGDTISDNAMVGVYYYPCKYNANMEATLVSIGSGDIACVLIISRVSFSHSKHRASK